MKNNYPQLGKLGKYAPGRSEKYNKRVEIANRMVDDYNRLINTFETENENNEFSIHEIEKIKNILDVSIELVDLNRGLTGKSYSVEVTLNGVVISSRAARFENITLYDANGEVPKKSDHKILSDLLAKAKEDVDGLHWVTYDINELM